MNAILHRSVSRLPVIAVLLALMPLTNCVMAQNSAHGPTWSQEDTLRIATEIQKRIAGLPTYGVFDWVTFGFQGKTVVLKGYASRPVLKNNATKVVKSIPGVESVDNQIQILPVSQMDDRIRAAVYNHIYTQPALRKYNANQGTLAQATGPNPNLARMGGGITNYPPQGFHAIHIIVRNGRVILYGVVVSESDAAIAGMQANSVPGVFSVDNDITVEGVPPKP